MIEESVNAGIRAYPTCSPLTVTTEFTMHNCQVFRGVPTWHPIQLQTDEEKMRAYQDAEVRRKLHVELVDWPADKSAQKEIALMIAREACYQPKPVE